MAKLSSKAACIRAAQPFKELNAFERANMLSVNGASQRKTFMKGTVFADMGKGMSAALVKDNANIERTEDARGATVYMYGRIRVVRRGGGGSRMFFMVLHSKFNT